MNILVHPQFGQIRTEQIKKETWFVVNDISKILGYSNTEKAMKLLDENEKLITQIGTHSQRRDTYLVNESGLYALIIRSDKPIAKVFKKWITSEVLPSICKYGFYTMDQNKIAIVEKLIEQKKVSELLTAIDTKLSSTDRCLVGKECLTDEQEVNSVLSGNKKDAHMMTLLYGRATGNKKFAKMFYTLEGASTLLNELNKEPKNN